MSNNLLYGRGCGHSRCRSNYHNRGRYNNNYSSQKNTTSTKKSGKIVKGNLRKEKVDKLSI